MITLASYIKGIFIHLCLVFCLLQALPALSTAQSICTVERSNTQIIITGFTRADKTVAITSEVNGRCLEVFADIGDPVPADSVFAKIDSTFIDIALSANKISQSKAEKKFLFYKNQVDRHKTLVSSKATALTRLEEIELKAEMSRLDIEELKTGQHRLKETRLRHIIHAPPDWLITERNVEPGQWVGAGQVIGRAGNFSQLTVPLAVSGEELQFLQTSGVFPLHIADGDISGSGMIKRVNPAFDGVTRKVNIDIGLTPETLVLINGKRGGLRVKIPITVADPVHSFLIPATAVREYHEEHRLTRASGEHLSIIVLGPEAGDTGRLRIVSEQIRPRDNFICTEEK